MYELMYACVVAVSRLENYEITIDVHFEILCSIERRPAGIVNNKNEHHVPGCVQTPIVHTYIHAC